MRRFITKVSFFIVTILLFSRVSPVFSAGVETSGADVSATVIAQSFNAPTLIAPTNNAAINTKRPTFSWNRPSPVPSTPLHHYDLYIDDAIFAASVSDSITSQTYYFYTATASAGIFYVSLNTDLTEGTHTWKVTAYNDAGISATSETRTFYVDSIYPPIGVTKVDTTNLTWTTSDPTTIPSDGSRYITVNTEDPLLKGNVETNANIKFVLICPQNISCTNQSWEGNNTTGTWDHRFYDLVPNLFYTVQISATDAAGNSTFFPDFYISFGVALVTPTSTPTPSTTPTPTTTITPSISISPTATPSPSPTATLSGTLTPTLPPLPSGTITPPPGFAVSITPTRYISSPPVSPTIPPRKDNTRARAIYLFYMFLIVLMIFGLPLHLAMTIFSKRISFITIPNFLYLLCYPFFNNKTHQTAPFTQIKFFISDQLNRPWQRIISDIKGDYALPASIPEKIYITLLCEGRDWKRNVLVKGSLINQSCLCPIIKTSLNTREKVRKLIYDLRVIPLVIACLTSTTALFIQPSIYIIIYLYFSLQYSYSEYIYPKLVRDE